MGFTRRVGIDVAQVTGMAFGRVRRAMLMIGWIKMSSRRSSLRVRAVAKLVDMKAMFTGRKAG